jgi:hypothetical protein
MSYGLTTLAAIVVTAFCFAYADELPPALEKSSFDPINNAHLTVSSMIETRIGNPRIRATDDQRQETGQRSLLQKTSLAEKTTSTIYSDSFQDDRGPLEAFHG